NARLRADARGCDGSLRQELATGIGPPASSEATVAFGAKKCCKEKPRSEATRMRGFFETPQLPTGEPAPGGGRRSLLRCRHVSMNAQTALVGSTPDSVVHAFLQCPALPLARSQCPLTKRMRLTRNVPKAPTAATLAIQRSGVPSESRLRVLTCAPSQYSWPVDSLIPKRPNPLWEMAR